jgi:hypothetical protein
MSLPSFIFNKTKLTNPKDLFSGLFYPSDEPILLGGERVGGFVVAHSQQFTSASWATSSSLQQSRLLNNPG